MTYSWKYLFVLLPLLVIMGSRNPPEHVDSAGEIMHYKLRYSIFKVGIATAYLNEDQSGNINQISVEVKSNGLVKIFNNMYYHLECNVNPTTGLPDSAVINLKDRKHSLHNELIFYQDLRPDSTIVMSKLTGKHVVSRNTYEVLSGFNYFRSDLIAGDKSDQEIVINTFYPDKVWGLRFHFADEEEVKTALGRQVCYKYNPGTLAGRFFENEDDMSVWFTKGEAHIPVRFRLNLKIGAIKGVLVEYSNPD